MYFYEILQKIMADKNLTIPDVARLTGLTDSTVRSMLARKNKTVSLEVAFKLAKGLQVSLEELNGDVPLSDTPLPILSPSQKKLYELAGMLTDTQADAACAFIHYLTEYKGKS